MSQKIPRLGQTDQIDHDLDQIEQIDHGLDQIDQTDHMHHYVDHLVPHLPL